MFQPRTGSPRWQLNKTDGWKIAKSFGLALAGFTLVWLGDVLIPGAHLPTSWGLLLGAMAPVLVNLGRKLVSGGPS